MPDITVALSEQQRKQLEEAARLAGMTVESYAAEAVSRAVEVRYVLPSTQGSVSPIKGLNQDKP